MNFDNVINTSSQIIQYHKYIFSKYLENRTIDCIQQHQNTIP